MEGRDHYASLECLEMNHEGYRARPDLKLELGIDPYRMLLSVGIGTANECASASGREMPGVVYAKYHR